MFEGIVQSNSVAAPGSGGGVGILTTGTFNLYHGTIKGNRAEYDVPDLDVESGGAVFAVGYHDDIYGQDNYGQFNMYGGTIGGENSGDANTATIGANAVWINGYGRFTMSGGTITGNAGFDNYGIIHKVGSYGSFTMKGTARIGINDKVLLYSYIIIGGTLSASPAANIVCESPVSGDSRLLGGSSNLVTENYRKFLYDGADNHISLLDLGSRWGVYND
jgi:hypothetical protein